MGNEEVELEHQLTMPPKGTRVAEEGQTATTTQAEGELPTPSSRRKKDYNTNFLPSVGSGCAQSCSQRCIRGYLRWSINRCPETTTIEVDGAGVGENRPAVTGEVSPCTLVGSYKWKLLLWMSTRIN